MRWESLFADLAAQWEAARREEDEARIADLAEAEMGRVTLADRLRATRGAALTLVLADGSTTTGTVLDAAVHWLLLADGERRRVVPVAAVAAAWPLGVAAPAPGVVEQRLTLGHVLRALAREGTVIRLRTRAGVYLGRVVRVGADHLDLVLATGGAGGGAERRVTVAVGGLLVIETA